MDVIGVDPSSAVSFFICPAFFSNTLFPEQKLPLSPFERVNLSDRVGEVRVARRALATSGGIRLFVPFFLFLESSPSLSSRPSGVSGWLKALPFEGMFVRSFPTRAYLSRSRCHRAHREPLSNSVIDPLFVRVFFPPIECPSSPSSYPATPRGF